MNLFRPSLFWPVALTIIVSALLFRLISLGLYPLMDTSEARYGEIIRLMVETNDWVIPYFDYGVPFLGKPPLFIWLSAISFKVFGINEFAVRLPALLCSLFTLWVVWKLAQFQMGKLQARLSVLILTSSAAFLVLSGAVLADPVMTSCITLIIASFWIGWHSENPAQARLWQYLFFVGCGVALLAKGLAALVLAGGPIFFWCLPQKRLLMFWQRFPWFRGILVSAIIALPWYIAAEMRSPGLIEYMMIGEHFSRYLDSGWQGDEYGNAHVHPYGTIWGYLALGAFPWSLLLIYFTGSFIWKKIKKAEVAPFSEWTYFLLCWSLFLPAFFTFTQNLIWTYVLPITPALALLCADLISKHWPKAVLKPLLLATVTPALMVITVIVLINDGGQKSHKHLIKHLHVDEPHPQGNIIYYAKRPFSARYYTHGKAKLAASEQEIMALMVDGKTDVLATRDHQFELFSESLRQQFEKKAQYRDWVLWIEKE